MKTIFITVFEGVESKNILRTDILKTLLADPDVRLVLFTKSEKRIAYHKREFNDPRIQYEAITLAPIGYLDALFKKLKFILLRTDTIDLRRRMIRHDTRNTPGYVVSWIANRILARRLTRRLMRTLDYQFVYEHTYASYFETYKPDIVLAANLFDEIEIHLVREAKQRGIKTIGFINSWDRATARCILRIIPDRLVVFNTVVKEELIRYHDIDAPRIFVGGIPQYDQYVTRQPISRKEYFRKINQDPQKRLIVYSPVGSRFCESDWEIIDMLYRHGREGAFGSDIIILVRFPPNEYIDEAEVAKRPFLVYDYPGVRFSEKRGIDWDMTFDELNNLSDTLYHMSLLICYTSSISVDAAMVNRPVINMKFDVIPSKVWATSPVQYYAMTHYMNVLASGGIRLVYNEAELITWVKAYLANPHLDEKGRQKLAREQCHFLDGKSGERIGMFVLGFLHATGEKKF